MSLISWIGTTPLQILDFLNLFHFDRDVGVCSIVPEYNISSHNVLYSECSTEIGVIQTRVMFYWIANSIFPRQLSFYVRK